MKKVKLSINNLKQRKSLSFKIKQSPKVIDNTEAYQSLSLDELDNNTNSIIDSEKKSFKLNQNKLFLTFRDADTSIKSYDSLGFSYEDLLFNRNRFKRSFIRAVFYDSSNPSNQVALFEQRFYLQLNEFVRDVNGDVDNTVSNLKIKLICQSPYVGLYNKNYYIYDRIVGNYPKNIYAYYSFNNALNGDSTTLVSKQSINSISQFNQNNYIKYTLFDNVGGAYYDIDDSNREITKTTNEVEINLYVTQF